MSVKKLTSKKVKKIRGGGSNNLCTYTSALQVKNFGKCFLGTY